MKSFFERDPGPIGIAGTVVLVSALVIALNTDRIPFLGGDTFHAQFSDASALRTGDEVQVAGVPVGKITDISLGDDAVDVEFTADLGAVELGADSTAAIKVHTVLGRRYLDLRSHGAGRLDGGATIPLERTVSGYDIAGALEDSASTVERTELDSMTGAFTSAGTVMDELSPELDTALTGLRSLSDTISTRDDEVRSLLANVHTLADVAGQRSDEISTLVSRGHTLFEALNQRSTTIQSLLITVRTMSAQLRALAAEHVDTLGPLLDRLDEVSEILERNRENIDQTLVGAPQYIRQLGEAIASGPYFGVTLQNVAPADLDQVGPSYGGGR